MARTETGNRQLDPAESIRGAHEDETRPGQWVCLILDGKTFDRTAARSAAGPAGGRPGTPDVGRESPSMFLVAGSRFAGLRGTKAPIMQRAEFAAVQMLSGRGNQWAFDRSQESNVGYGCQAAVRP